MYFSILQKSKNKNNGSCITQTKVINLGSDIFDNPIFQKGLQN